MKERTPETIWRGKGCVLDSNLINYVDKGFLGDKVLIDQIMTRVMSETKINIT